MALIHVAVGILHDENGRILIAKRPAKKCLAGYWEFPGGKVEDNEPVFDALAREFAEEVDLSVIKASAWQKITYHYDDFSVLLDIWKITQYSGKAKPLEQQEILWVETAKLNDFQFAPANQKIIEDLLTNA